MINEHLYNSAFDPIFKYFLHNDYEEVASLPNWQVDRQLLPVWTHQFKTIHSYIFLNLLFIYKWFNRYKHFKHYKPWWKYLWDDFRRKGGIQFTFNAMNQKVKVVGKYIDNMYNEENKWLCVKQYKNVFR